MPTRPISTYSIVAHDPKTNQLGAAVQSHFFCVGPLVPWAEAGVGAVATQSFAEVTYGPLGLAMMRAGKTAKQALTGLLASDPQAETRQVAMVDVRGNVAAHTGRRCIEAAGHRLGAHYSVQANLMLKDTVWGAMAEAYEAAGGDLANRLMAALDAAQAEGGDIRGKQSAALLVVGGEPSGNPWTDRLFDLRVDDHPDPLSELRRLVSIARAYRLGDEAEQALVQAAQDERKYEEAAGKYRQCIAFMPDIDANPELLYWQAVAMASAGRVEDALPIFQRVFALDPAWRDLVPRLVKAEILPDDAQVIERITGQ